MLKFKNKVGFSNGYSKQLHLGKIIKKIKYPNWKTKLKILELLKESSKTHKELGNCFKLSKGVIWHHLQGGKKQTKREKIQKD